ncbi:MAG TPA: hypothetical protein VFT59_02975 [Candidatus Saccharimonadales bacterium]|nr:hypothetical protein [Candidatus Saccharimonadales bacterium]
MAASKKPTTKKRSNTASKRAVTKVKPSTRARSSAELYGTRITLGVIAFALLALAFLTLVMSRYAL